jgi:putative transposase
MQRRVHRYQSVKMDDDAIIDCLGSMVEKHPGLGFWKLYHMLRQQGFGWNHKRVYRVYKQMHLNIKRKAKKRLPARIRKPLLVPETINQTWSMDFITDSLWNGKKFRVLNIMDDYNREVLAMEVGTSISAHRVIRVLEQLNKEQLKPNAIRVDNGPEFISRTFRRYCQDNGIEVQYIQPGKPVQNGFIERLNGSYRKELLDLFVFKEIEEVDQLTFEWKENYNNNRPHQSLNNLPPSVFKQKMCNIEIGYN